MADCALPEREPHPAIHAGLQALIHAMRNEELGDLWVAVYVRWELGVLAELGYGLILRAVLRLAGMMTLLMLARGPDARSRFQQASPFEKAAGHAGFPDWTG